MAKVMDSSAASCLGDLPSLSRTSGETLSQCLLEHFAQRFDFAAALCDVTIVWRVVLLFSLKNVRFSCDHDSFVRKHTPHQW